MAAASLLRSGFPLELPWRDGERVSRSLARFRTGRYDLVWYFGLRPWVLAGGYDSAPTVLDFSDLEDQKIAARLAVPADRPVGTVSKLRARAGRAFSAEERRRWQRTQLEAASRVSATVVCSDLDRQRAVTAGMAAPRVVPNGYRSVDQPVGRTAVRTPPTVLFQGTLRYPPNAQAARFLVDEIGPLLRALVPDIRIRLVGVTTPAIAALEDPPRVTFAGRVPDIETELAGADLIVVPIRFGSGTRVKILEAFAERIPVVSTALGAEGLEAKDGIHLLLADDADGIATACHRVLVDQGLRTRLVDNAHRLFSERFRDEIVEQAVAQVAGDVVAAATSAR